MGKYRKKCGFFKKKGAVLLALLLCILNLLPVYPVTVQAAQSNDTPIDFVLILDCSGSMEKSDEENLSVSAAKMFVDMLPAENARLAVIAMGPNYGSEAYPLDGLLSEEQKGGLGEKNVKEAFSLQSITDQDAKQEAKDVIDRVTEEGAAADKNSNYTPIGYALKAAGDVLTKNGTAPDSASIILLSDGRVSGEADGSRYNDALDYTTIDEQEQQAYENGWPIYCLELNYDHANVENGGWEGKVGWYQMPKIAQQTDGERITLNSPTEAQNAFANIFAKFFEATPTTASGTIQDGVVSLDFNIEEMVAETNITLTGNINEVNEITIRNSDGKEYTYQKSTVDDNRIITYDNRENKKYITAKLLTPKEGAWSITAKGTDGVEIGLYAVSIREMNLQLNAQTDRLKNGSNEANLPKGAVVDFTASYIYNNSPYSSATFYRDSKAYLYIAETGEKIPMEGSDDNYSGTITFDKSGDYTVKTLVESDKFRNEQKESGSYLFHVGNIVTEATGTIADQEVNVGGSLDPIDCSQYFTNEDNDPLTYTVDYDSTSGIIGEIEEDGKLTLKAGTVAGAYQITVGAKDPMMETPAKQSFTVTMVNQPMTLADGIEDGAEEVVDFSYNADSLPEFLLKLAKVPKDSEKTIQWSDYFEDPDGLPISVEVSEEETNEVITMTKDEMSMHLVGTGKGTAVYNVKATDTSDSNVVHNIKIKVNSCDAKALVWKMIRIPVIIAAVILLIILFLLIYAFGGRKIYGTWDVTCGMTVKKSCVFGKTSAGKKAKCNVQNLLGNLGIQNNFNGVKLEAGNKFGKSVYLTGVDKLDSLVYGAAKYDKVRLKKTKKLRISPRQSVTLTKGETSVKLERKK